jgi:hypothetical protein
MKVAAASIFAIALCLQAVAASAQSPLPPTATSATPGDAAAAPMSATLQSEARTDYQAARILYMNQDYAGALVKFQRAYELSGEPRLLWNMAACEKFLRHYAAVLRLLERYEREYRGVMSPGHRAEFTDVLKTVRLLVTRVHIQADPDGAHVFLDEVLVGTTPLAEPLLVDLGQRKIRIHKSGYKDHLITRNYSDTSEVILRLKLQRDLHQGTLAVNASTSDAIRVDGRLVGHGVWHGLLPSGEHTLRVTASGMRAFERQVFIEDDRTRNLYVTLDSEPASGISPLLWVGMGLAAASGVAVASYFALRSNSSSTSELMPGSWGTYPLP